jgi:hypothetical protein
MTDDKPRRRLSAGTFFMLFLLAYQIILSVVLMFVLQRVALPYIHFTGLVILSQVLMFLVPLGIWLGIRKERLSVHIPNMKMGSVNTIFVFGISFFMLPLMMLISALSIAIIPNVENAAVDIMGQAETYSVWMLLLAVAVTPAIIEEVVFRGYIQSQYAGKPFWRVAVINGFFFGVIHMNLNQFFYAFAMGVVMAYMVYYTRSIRSAILSHFLLNAFNIVLFRGLPWLLDRMEEILYESGGEEAVAELQASIEAAEAGASVWASILTVGVVALIFLPLFILIFRAFISHNRQRFAAYDIKQALSEEAAAEE